MYSMRSASYMSWRIRKEQQKAACLFGMVIISAMLDGMIKQMENKPSKMVRGGA